MFGTHDLALFIASGLLLNMAPGPDSLLIMTRSATGGWRAGSAASLGICTGTFVHLLAAALGLSALLATSATAFTVVKMVGAAYLVYIGGGMLLRGRRRGSGTTPAAEAPPAGDTTASAAAPQPLPPWQPAAPPYRSIFLQGLTTNVLNPKVALFFLAFVPQFIAPEAPSKALAFIALGCVFNVNSLLWCHVLVAFTTFASRRVRFGAAVVRWLERLIGALFVSFGIKLALQNQS
jgi:threonine/homoserine/homoserine lactone efflux protein